MTLIYILKLGHQVWKNNNRVTKIEKSWYQRFNIVVNKLFVLE